jgi:hypothetical protein
VRAAHSEAVARCVSGVPRFSGRSAVASASVNGLELGLDRATTEVVRLIDSQSIDPSDIDIAQVLPPGADLSAFKAVVQPILDALPNITVPVALARVKVTPNERIETGTKLTQRALHATISIAGRRLADVIVGEAAVGVGDVSCGGVADRRYVGRRVRIRSRATGRTVARPKVSRDGTFRATAPLPEARLRPTNRARYEATIGKQRSMRLKLQRRMLVTEMAARHGRVTIAGRGGAPAGDAGPDGRRAPACHVPRLEGRQALQAAPGWQLPRAPCARRRTARLPSTG